MLQSPSPKLTDMPSTYSRLIARELGLSVKQMPDMLQGTGLKLSQFLLEDHGITADQQIRILANAMQLSPHPDFGLRLGKRLTPSTHGAMGFVANSSADLLTAMQAVEAFLPTRANLVSLTVGLDHEWLDCVLSYDVDMEGAVRRCLSETLIKALLEIAEFVLGFVPDRTVICFTHVAPEYQRLYAHHLPGQIEFNSEKLMLRFPASLSREPNAAANHENYLLAFRHCEAMLAELPEQRQGYQLRVKKMMLSHPPGTLSEDEAASALFVSKRTLARKLAGERSSFRQIRDEIMSQQAAEYLCRERLSVEAVATLLNYHDGPSFRRAFKRWFGMTPCQYLANHVA